MKKISHLRNTGVLAGFFACPSIPARFVRTMLLSFLVLSTGPAEAGDAEMSRVIELHLSSTSPSAVKNHLSSAPPPDNTVTVLSQKRVQGAPPAERNPELSRQHLVVVGLNAQGQEISRTVMLDPRILRAETVDLSGKLTNPELLYRNDVTFSVAVPDDPGVIGVKVYQPRWTGTEYALDLIGEVKLPEVPHD
jgi:hypothetical protein